MGLLLARDFSQYRQNHPEQGSGDQAHDNARYEQRGQI
jgi:hypothetical protein